MLRDGPLRSWEYSRATAATDCGANRAGPESGLLRGQQREVTPWDGGASTFENPSQLPVKARVWPLPKGSQLGHFVDIPDGLPYGNHAAGHHSLVIDMPLQPADLIAQFLGLGWLDTGKTK